MFISLSAYAQCPTPNGLFTTNVTYNSALANWTPVSGAVHYKIHYRIFGTTTWGNLGNIWGDDSTRNLPLLVPGTTYEWEIKSFCDSTNQLASNWSANDTFTTPLFVASPFNPIINNTLSTNQCNTLSELNITLSQVANEPDIGESTITSNAGFFDFSGVSIGDSIGYASLNMTNQTINSKLEIGLIINNNYAIINSIDSSNNLVGFFTIENLNPGIRVTTTSPNDGNNYTSGYTSNIRFTNIFVTPNYDGPLNFNIDLISEQTDSIYEINENVIITIYCPSAINNILENKKSIVNYFDLYGRKTTPKENKIILIKYLDGTSEKIIVID